MKQLDHASEHSRETNSLSNFKSELAKLWATVALSTALLVGNPTPTQAQTPEKKPVQTEQVEKQKAPDMIKFAKDNFSKYFTAEEKQYFEHIFHIISRVEQHIQEIANLYLKKHGEQFENEKDKMTFILMTLELINGETQFTEAHEIQDDLDRRVVAANNVVQDMTKHFKEENARAKEENARAKEENARAKEENAKAKENLRKSEEELKSAKEKRAETKINLEKIKAKNKITKEKLKEALQGLERVLSEVSPEVVKSNKQAQEVVRYYETFCKENGYTPTEHAKKLIALLPKK